MRLFASILCAAALGCGGSESDRSSEKVQTESTKPLRPALAKLLAYYDAHYDSDAHLLRWAYASPGYHTRMRTGDIVHPIRESFFYALALLQRDSAGDASRAADILRAALPLQSRDEADEAYGVWPYVLEESLGEMSAPDWNWADFCGAQVAQMLVQHREQLPEDLREEMRESLRAAATAIQKRNVGPGYTNIAILGGGVCCAAGEILGETGLLKYGRERLQACVEHTKKHGGFSEYNSPPYGKVVIAECERVIHIVEDSDAKAAAEALRRAAWQMVAESFHPATMQWAGPHSRTSRERLRASTVDFLSARLDKAIPPHPAMAAGEPRGFAVVEPVPCPADLAESFQRTISEPYQLQRTFLKSRTPDNTIRGVTWFSQDACLGSVNRSSFWTQRKPLVAYWKTDEDPAVVFRMRFLHDGQDFASMGVRTAQHNHRVLCAVHSMQRRGDWHRTLDRPQDGAFQAADFRLRFQLRGEGVRGEKLSGGRFALIAGGHRIVVHAISSQFESQPVRWELVQEEGMVAVDAICYAGERRRFDFSRPIDMQVAAGIELISSDEKPSGDSPQIEKASAVWKTVGLRIKIAQP